MAGKKAIRVGKTKKDHATGAWQRRFANMLARGNWSNGTDSHFPSWTCHGKGNSSKAKKYSLGVVV